MLALYGFGLVVVVLSVLLGLSSATGVFTPTTKSELITAVNAHIAGVGIYGPISEWNTSLITNMNEIFKGRQTFNDDISGWDVSSVTDMTAMFFTAFAFNQDIGGWDVSSVSSMLVMFYQASSFNQDVSGWDVSSVTDMNMIFDLATSFNQDICWDLHASVTPSTVVAYGIHDGPALSEYSPTTQTCGCPVGTSITPGPGEKGTCQVPPTLSPTVLATHAPTLFPTNAPTLFPTNAPTLTPTLSPTFETTVDLVSVLKRKPKPKSKPKPKPKPKPSADHKKEDFDMKMVFPSREPTTTPSTADGATAKSYDNVHLVSKHNLATVGSNHQQHHQGVVVYSLFLAGVVVVLLVFVVVNRMTASISNDGKDLSASSDVLLNTCSFSSSGQQEKGHSSSRKLPPLSSLLPTIEDEENAYL